MSVFITRHSRTFVSDFCCNCDTVMRNVPVFSFFTPSSDALTSMRLKLSFFLISV